MASEKILEQKKQIVADMAEKMKNSVSGVFVDYKGINVEDDTKLRTEFRKNGVEYGVVKNTLVSKACDLIGFEKIKDVLEGMTALALSPTDPVIAAKIANEFASKNDNYVIKAGFIDGEMLDANGVKELAAIPSKEILIGRIMGSLQSSLYSFAYVLQAIIDKSGEEVPAAASEEHVTEATAEPAAEEAAETVAEATEEPAAETTEEPAAEPAGENE